jgi:hypothetical protein
MNKKKPKAKTNHSVKKSQEQEYLGSLDLREWWEVFATSMNKNGTQKFPTVWSFIKAKAKHKWQRHFLYWLLGPKASEGKSNYSAFPQYDWESKRDNGFWYSSKNIENLRAEIKRKDTSFARLQTAGESLIDDLAELSELQKQISREFGPRLFLDNLKSDENASRVSLYLTMKRQVQEMKAHLLQTFAKTQGMDMNQLSNFLELFAHGMGSAASAQLGYGGGAKQLEGSKEEKQYNSVLGQLCDMTLRKSAELELALPDSEAERIVQETVRPNGNGKIKRVQ